MVVLSGCQVYSQPAKHTQSQKEDVEAKFEHICSNIISLTRNRRLPARLLIIPKSRRFCKRSHLKRYIETMDSVYFAV